MTTYLMNIYTGSVEEESIWATEGFTKDNSDLVEVVRNSEGDWEEVK